MRKETATLIDWLYNCAYMFALGCALYGPRLWWTVSFVLAVAGIVTKMLTSRATSKQPSSRTSVMIPSEPPRWLDVDLEQETDGRFIADISEVPGAIAYGSTREEAIRRAAVIALDVLSDRQDYTVN